MMSWLPITILLFLGLCLQVLVHHRERQELNNELEVCSRKIDLKAAAVKLIEQSSLLATTRKEQLRLGLLLNETRALIEKPPQFLPDQPDLRYRHPPSREKLCLLVAFRDGCGRTNQGLDREMNLAEFVAGMRAHLLLSGFSEENYTLVVAEQTQAGLFNKGILFNAAFSVGVQHAGCTYAVFHDVDHLPNTLANDYRLRETPLHMCVRTTQVDFKPYQQMVGGAVMFRITDYERVNGFSNMLDGWGKEDDDMYQRITKFIGPPHRLDPDVGFYRALDHRRVQGLDHDHEEKKAWMADPESFKDGLSSLAVRGSFEQFVRRDPTYIRFLVSVKAKDGSEPEPCS